MCTSDQTLKLSQDSLKSMHKTISSKHKKLGLEFPKNPKSEGHTMIMQDYLTKILGINELILEPEIKGLFKLNFFYDEVKKQEDMYEAVAVPE